MIPIGIAASLGMLNLWLILAFNALNLSWALLGPAHRIRWRLRRTLWATILTFVLAMAVAKFWGTPEGLYLNLAMTAIAWLVAIFVPGRTKH